MSDTFYVTPVSELEKLDDWNNPLAFQAAHHHENMNVPDGVEVEWRLRDRMKTVSVALVMCLHIGVDPPDVPKINPCSKLECWIDPFTMTPRRALETIAAELQRQYERWQSKARYKSSLDPTQEDIKKLCLNLRRSSRDERILFHYNGHGVPRPTANGEIWVFNKNFTQYIPLSLYDLQKWMSSPSIYVFDCSHAGVVLNLFAKFAEQTDKELEENRRNLANNPLLKSNTSLATTAMPPLPTAFSPINDILLGACGENELLPMNPELPADLFTSCLTTPIRIALHWYVFQKNISRLNPNISPDMIDKIPGTVTDRKSMLGELNWIFTAVTDTIAWNSLPKDLFQRLFRQDLLVASLFRNFLLAERIMRSYGCHVCSKPTLPPMHEHRLWDAWDMALDLCLKQLPAVLKQTENDIREPIYEPSSFFADQLTAFSVWLGENSLLSPTEKSNLKQPEQLPIVLQVLLSQSHRQRALDLLARFLDIGTWAVHLALSVGIFPYVLRLLQATSDDLRPYLVFIWAKILAVDRACQVDIIREKGHEYFVSTLADHRSTIGVRALAAFNLTCLVDNYTKGQDELLPVMPRVLDILNTPIIEAHETSALYLWSALFLGQAWRLNENACEKAVLIRAPDTLQTLLKTHDSSEVRAACAYALGTYLSSTTTNGNGISERRIEQSKEAANVLINSLHDGSPLVRREVLVALRHFRILFSQASTTNAPTIINSVNRSSNSPYKTIFDKVTEAIQTVALLDPSNEMAEMAETVLNDLQKPIGTKFFQWCCSRFRASNTITRDLGSGISQQRGAFYNGNDDIDDCFARSGRYWRNHCIRSSPSRLADFQHMRETQISKPTSTNTPLVLRVHPYENYLVSANSHGNLLFHEFDGTPRAKSRLKVGIVGTMINTLDFINAHDRTLICVGTDDGAIRIFDEATDRMLSSWIAFHGEHAHSNVTRSRSTSNSSTISSNQISLPKFVVDWNQHLCRLYASSTNMDHISLWDVEHERCLYTMDTNGSGGVHCLISDDNGFCAAGMGDGTVRCFDARSTEAAITITPQQTLINRHAPIIALKSDANERLLSISKMGQLRRWDIQTGTSTEVPVPQISQTVLAADVHLTGNVIALATTNALQFKTCFGDLLFDIKHQKFAQVSCLSFHKYRQLLAVGFQDGSLSMFTGKTNSSSV